jgi:hypothetical protein
MGFEDLSSTVIYLQTLVNEYHIFFIIERSIDLVLALILYRRCFKYIPGDFVNTPFQIRICKQSCTCVTGIQPLMLYMLKIILIVLVLHHCI